VNALSEKSSVLVAINSAKATFAEIGYETPRLDAELLIAEALGTDRISLYSNLDRTLNAGEIEKFRALVDARAEGCPVAYLRGKKEFMSIEFSLTRDVPIPRPETEFVVEAILAEKKESDEFFAADLCTGSGNIACSIARYRPKARVIATDVSAKALEVARKNAGTAGVADRVEFLEGDMFAAFAGRALEGAFDVIACNPPYVSESEFAALHPGIRNYEPAGAFLAGADGLDFLRVIAAGAPRFMKPGGLLVLEIGDSQADAVVKMLDDTRVLTELKVTKDYLALDRIASCRFQVPGSRFGKNIKNG
jgi:release factor glutamine methyltransferase